MRLFIKMLVTLMMFLSSAFAYTPQYTDGSAQKLIRWKENRIKIEISNTLFKNKTNIKSNSDVIGAIKNSFQHWEDVANIKFEYSLTSKEKVSPKDTAGDGTSLITIAPTSENILLFDEQINNTSAITRLFYNSKGDIKEADIVLNPIQLFTTDGTYGTFDLEATLTHEIGHLIGLGHSQIIGSTMHSHQGKNGTYNLPNFSSRTLAQDDKAGAVALYGARSEDENCCRQIEGKLNVTNSRVKRQFQVWVEKSDSGQVIAGVLSDEDGNYLIQGLPKSTYEIYARDLNATTSQLKLGTIDLTEKQTTPLTTNVALQLKDFQVTHLGFNGQLSTQAIPVNAGKTYIIYVGGINLDPDKIEIGFHSENFKVNRASLTKHNYGPSISVVSFEVEILKNTEPGEYSLYLQGSAKRMEYLIGGITVESEENPWYSTLF